jgi:hypothetical protein
MFAKVCGLQGDAVLLFGMSEEGLEEGPQAAVPAAKREARFLSALVAHFVPMERFIGRVATIFASSL